MADNLNNDPTTRIGNNNLGHVIHFVHVATRATCHFKAFLTSWEDNFKQDWSSYETVGRMDPVKTYKRTSRIINFSFDIPSYDAADASHNLHEIQKLIQMSYPTFNVASSAGKQEVSSVGASAEVIQQKNSVDQAKILNSQTSLSNAVSHMVSPPFLRIKFSNWLNDPSLDIDLSNNDAYGEVTAGSGLYGTIENVKFVPDLSENGGFYGPNDLYPDAVENRLEKILVPKLLKLDIVFNVLHTNDLGYYANNGAIRTAEFPYNAGKISDKMSESAKIRNKKIIVG